MGFDWNEIVEPVQSAGYELFLLASRSQLMPRITSGRRTAMQQLKLWRAFLNGQAHFPAAPPGLSGHEYGVAFDMVVEPFDALADVADVWISAGFAWGGQGDPVHFSIANERHYVLEHLSLEALAIGVDFALSFLPGIGTVATAAAIAQLYPPWSRSALLQAVSSPVETLVDQTS